jgi:SAM-dependent methyltransferase
MTLAEVKSFLGLVAPAPGARVLDLGCGWGRHLAPLVERGTAPQGVDRSLAYCRRAFAETSSPIACADVRALPYRDASFDAVGCFYSSIFFFEDNENQAALAEVRRVLRPGGAFVLQTASPVHLRQLGPETRSFALGAGRRVTESTHFVLGEGREHITRRLTQADGSDLEGTISIRHYAPGELEVLARRVGLKVEQVLGSLSHEAWTRRSRELVAVLRKPS